MYLYECNVGHSSDFRKSTKMLTISRQNVCWYQRKKSSYMLKSLNHDIQVCQVQCIRQTAINSISDIRKCYQLRTKYFKARYNVMSNDKVITWFLEGNFLSIAKVCGFCKERTTPKLNSVLSLQKSCNSYDQNIVLQ